ncbi:uncharacterized protein LOC127814110 isoform X2 [Diospyros lotus]|uniref:uncharacterized protein LOC127814110 isoform X2 n=1 Tax=Diospyros lotus TaxID=55363 RepID=UPI0022550723|nr:uncharacterized protein LOC127814110 isoform X2 [Diospyros lotus]
MFPKPPPLQPYHHCHSHCRQSHHLYKVVAAWAMARESAFRDRVGLVYKQSRQSLSTLMVELHYYIYSTSCYWIFSNSLHVEWCDVKQFRDPTSSFNSISFNPKSRFK